jgi:hypothetical protein
LVKEQIKLGQNMKKLFFLKLTLILLIATLFAESSINETVTFEDKITKMDEEVIYENDTDMEKNQMVDVCSCGIDDSDLFRRDEAVVYLDWEFLYWTASCGNNEYAFQYNKEINVAGSYYGLGNYKFSKYDWDPCFRVTLGWFNAPKTYRVIGQFQWIRISNTKTSFRNNNATEPLVATFPQNTLLGQELAQAHSKIRVNNELGDFLASRVWFPNLHCRLCLFGGLTGGRIQQKWQVIYEDVIGEKESVTNRWKFTGIGFRAGINFDWFWTRNFYMTGKASFAPLVGKYKYFGKISLESGSVEHANFKYDQWRGAYNVQAYLGPSYQKSYTNNRFEIFAGYELNGWFNVHELIRNSVVTNSNYLTTEEIPRINKGLFLLHGLNIRLTVDF